MGNMQDTGNPQGMIESAEAFDKWFYSQDYFYPQSYELKVCHAAWRAALAWQQSRAQQAAPAQVAGEAGRCEWIQQIDADSDHWVSDCKREYCFNEEGPDENGMNFCFGCGKPILATPFKDDEEEDSPPTSQSISTNPQPPATPDHEGEK